jgi:hypothetical protein
MSHSKFRPIRAPQPQDVVGSEGGSAPMLPPRDYDKPPKEDIERAPEPQTPADKPWPKSS